MKVLDLFSGTQSVRKALDLMNIEYEYYGIDIYSPEEENIILDLSQDDIVNKVIEVLPSGWMPDFIWASPVCNKFSISMGVKGGTVYFEKTKNGLIPRENMDVLKDTSWKSISKDSIDFETSLHISLVKNMSKILDYYNVDFVIENPYTSYIEFFLPPLIIKNKVSYCRYGFPYRKDTAIYSNVMLNLKTCNHETHEQDVWNFRDKKKPKSCQERSQVPPQLIKDILNIFRKEVIK